MPVYPGAFGPTPFVTHLSNANRDSRRTESIAVGNSEFAQRIKNAMGAMARRRSIRGMNDSVELRETQSAYNAIFDPENCDIDPKSVCLNGLFHFITAG